MSSPAMSPPSNDTQAASTRRDDVERRLLECETALADAHRLQRTFAHGISHELRAPLRAIDGFAAQLAAQTEGGGAAARDQIDRIRAAAARMAGLIDALLDLSHAEYADLKPQPVDLSLLADWTAAELQDAHPGREAEILIEPGLFTYGDERQLKLLMAQLLDNAWKFSNGRNRVRIEISGVVEAGRMRLSIRDYGAGFDMRYAGKLFEPFQRLHGAEYPGHGIGLTIAQRVAARHHGSIDAHGETGVGSTFVLELPAAEPEVRA